MRVKALLYTLIIALNLPALAQLSDEKLTTESNVAMTINNLGLFGNAFRGSFTQRNFPSCQFPRGSNIEHVFQGGVWVGAYKQGNSQPLVSTASFDSNIGYVAGRANFEFTTRPGAQVEQRSSLRNRVNFSPQAISHQDLLATAFDTAILVPGTTTNQPIPNHEPLGARVDLEAYNWNFPFANFFVLLNYKITNISNLAWDSVYLGIWGDGVVRNVSRTPPGGTPFYNKGLNGYMHNLWMAYEADANGDPGFTESYVGFKFLGADSLNERGEIVKTFSPACQNNFNVNFQSWGFNGSDPAYFTPQSDLDRYFKMSESLANADGLPEAVREYFRAPGNRVNLLSSGPYRRIAPGATISMVFAIVCAPKDNSEGLPNTEDTPIQRTNLTNNAIWAQSAFNGEDANGNCILDPEEDRPDAGKPGVLDRFILPSPPDVPNTRVVSRRNSVDIYWDRTAERSIDPISRVEDFEGYKIYKSDFAFDMQPSIQLDSAMKLIAWFDQKGNNIGFDNGLESIKLPQDTLFDGDTTHYTYKYTIKNLQTGWQHVVALTAFDRGDKQRNLPILETGVRANLFSAFTGTPANNDIKADKPFVYPNPYYAGAAWEGVSLRPEDKKLIFANLPKRCRVKIFTASGDFVDEFEHNADTYRGDVGWYNRYANFGTEGQGLDYRVFSGGEHAWDLLSRDTQIIARGLYLFTVEDLDKNQNFKGKFVIIK